MDELRDYLLKGKNCTLTQGMIDRILELTEEYADCEWNEGYDCARDNQI